MRWREIRPIPPETPMMSIHRLGTRIGLYYGIPDHDTYNILRQPPATMCPLPFPTPSQSRYYHRVSVLSPRMPGRGHMIMIILRY